MSRISLPYQFIWSETHPHVAWADIHNNGVLSEISVMALDPKNGDLYYIPIASLDTIDRERFLKVISKRDAGKYPLWDLLSGTTLKNGVNALEYFNQLVKCRTVSGQIFTPQQGKVGAGGFSAKPNIQAQPVNQEALATATASAAYGDTQEAEPKRGPGRPPAPKR